MQISERKIGNKTVNFDTTNIFIVEAEVLLEINVTIAP